MIHDPSNRIFFLTQKCTLYRRYNINVTREPMEDVVHRRAKLFEQLTQMLKGASSRIA